MKKINDLIQKLLIKYSGDESQSFVLLPHVAADGDALGSSLALCLFLREHGHAATVWLEEAIAPQLQFIEAQELLYVWGRDSFVDTHNHRVIILDAGEISRLGERQAMLDNCLSIDIIDHHQPSTKVFAGKEALAERCDLVWIEPARSSVSEMVAKMLLTVEYMNATVANLLLTGIYSDTFGLRYANCRSETFYIVASLVQCTDKLPKIAELLFSTITATRQKVKGWLFYNRELWKPNVVFSLIDGAKFSELDADDNDTEGVCAELRQVEGIDLAILAREISPNNWKISLRSSDEFDCAAIAAKLGGGGHKRAAGIKLTGDETSVRRSLEDCIN